MVLGVLVVVAGVVGLVAAGVEVAPVACTTVMGDPTSGLAAVPAVLAVPLVLEAEGADGPIGGVFRSELPSGAGELLA